ncbi:hypothetical protein [Vibrio tarriae]|uniref:hypothetical protein n=1 Tax=Vibrio tarriae TaxID=2014742 RepID=UPI000DE2A292|nr:hypothetical protein [Vibrio tarriae]RBM24506.1 hypothetical protein DLR59_19200 [Vibrio tarriae]
MRIYLISILLPMLLFGCSTIEKNNSESDLPLFIGEAIREEKTVTLFLEDNRDQFLQGLEDRAQSDKRICSLHCETLMICEPDEDLPDFHLCKPEKVCGHICQSF